MLTSRYQCATDQASPLGLFAGAKGGAVETRYVAGFQYVQALFKEFGRYARKDRHAYFQDFIPISLDRWGTGTQNYTLHFPWGAEFVKN
jgi:hypothetical protein